MNVLFIFLWVLCTRVVEGTALPRPFCPSDISPMRGISPTGYIDESLLCGSSDVRCLIVSTNSDLTENDDNSIVCSADVINHDNGYVSIYVDLSNSSILKTSGNYKFYFINANGDTFYENTFYVP